MSASSRPTNPRSPLRKVFDGAERAVASRAEPLAQSGGFATALSVYVSVNRKLFGALGSATGGVLHFVKIPTTRDVGRLHQHLATVDSHLAELIHELEERSGTHAREDQGDAAAGTQGEAK